MRDNKVMIPNLATLKTREAAEKHERAVQYFKHY
jgi:hypothetical protein